MKSLSTITFYFGLTIVGMCFASFLAWLCTIPYGQAIILALPVAILLWLLVEARKGSSWRTAFFGSVLPLAICYLLVGFICWCVGRITLDQLETDMPIGLAVIAGIITISGFVLALFVIFLFFDFLFILFDGTNKVKTILHHLFVLFVAALGLAVIASTLYFIIYPMCLP